MANGFCPGGKGDSSQARSAWVAIQRLCLWGRDLWEGRFPVSYPAAATSKGEPELAQIGR
jgi:hypothetical protein